MRLPAAIEDAAARAGLAGAAGIALAVFAAAVFVSAVLPTRARIDDLRAQLIRMQRTAGAGQTAPDQAARVSGQLALFTRNFPVLTEVPGWILRMHDIAARNDLALEAGEYRLTPAKDGGLARYQITLPLHGGYAQVRTFLDEVLTEIPAAALDEVTIRRENVMAAATQTRVRLTLYLAGAQ